MIVPLICIYIYIYYRGTDSIHLNYEDVGNVEKIYKEKYGSELVGEDLGDFHIDFSMDKANTGIYAIDNLFLGKITYMYILESIGKDCKTINSEHIRMKGIPAPCIKYYVEQHSLTVLDVYTKLFNNKTIKFDLANDGNKFVCRKIKIIHYQMKHISLESANTSEMKVISSLLVKLIIMSTHINYGDSDRFFIF